MKISPQYSTVVDGVDSDLFVTRRALLLSPRTKHWMVLGCWGLVD